jgi:hypothetical protein
MTRAVAVMGICVLALGVPGGVYADLVVNGGFEDTSNVTPPPFPGGGAGIAGVGGIGQLGYNTVATGWTSPDTSFVNGTGYNFIWNPATASTTGSNGYNGGIALWGPGNGFNNGLVPSPVGGQFLGADGDTRYRGRVEQTINGLTAGHTYLLGFWWAVAQQAGAGGLPHAEWDVSFGAQTQSTPVVTLPAPGGFLPWMYQTFTFKADGASDVLSFLANEGGPFGGPPFLLLDGVSLNPVPEPSTMMLTSFAALTLLVIGVLRRARGRRPVITA